MLLVVEKNWETVVCLQYYANDAVTMMEFFHALPGRELECFLHNRMPIMLYFPILFYNYCKEY